MKTSPNSHRFFGRSPLAALCALTFLSAARAQLPPNRDQVLVYDMKEDPTLADFVGVPAIPGFYGLEIDEWNGEGVLIFTYNEVVYQVRTGLRIKDDRITLSYKKKRKSYVRVPAADGKPEQIYPSECPPALNGWRRGLSYGRHFLRRNDEHGVQILVSNARLEFDLAKRRCRDFAEDCGSAGCPAWETAASSAAPVAVAAVPVKKPEAPAAPTVPLSQALLEAKLSGNDFFLKYKSDIDAMLPPQLTDTIVQISTGYRTTDMPFFGMDDTFVKQRALKFGIIEKNYLLEDKVSTMTISIEPLVAEFQAPQANKCGSWLSDPAKTFFDVRGQPALYQSGNTLYVCGKTVSLSVTSTSPRTKEALQAAVEALPVDQIEQRAGAPK